MAQPSSFYDYAYSWQGLQYEELLNTLLNSCHSIMSHPSCETLGELISYVIQQQQLDGYYRLEVCDQLFIEHFQQGRHVFYQGERPQKGSNYPTVKVVELEHAIIFKMRFIHLYLTKHHSNSECLEDTRDIWLLWLMHIESLCLQTSLNHCYRRDLDQTQQARAMQVNFHVDLKVNMTRLERQMKDMYQDYDQHVMSLMNLSETLLPDKRLALLERALNLHQEKLSHLIKQQYGLFLSTERLLQAILDDE